MAGHVQQCHLEQMRWLLHNATKPVQRSLFKEFQTCTVTSCCGFQMRLRAQAIGAGQNNSRIARDMGVMVSWTKEVNEGVCIEPGQAPRLLLQQKQKRCLLACAPKIGLRHPNQPFCISHNASLVQIWINDSKCSINGKFLFCLSNFWASLRARCLANYSRGKGHSKYDY